MNEAETKIVKQYIELMEDDRCAWLNASANALTTIIESHEYEALKALVEDKPSRTIKSPSPTDKVSIEAVRDALKVVKNKPDAAGWIKWDGGERPVNGNVMVDIRVRRYANKPESTEEHPIQTNKAFDVCWENGNMFYRIVEKPYFHTGAHIASILVEEPKKPKKQTLLEYLCGCCPNFAELSTEGLMCKVSEYLENKED